MKTVLVTGAAGFIGYHAAKALLEMSVAVIGVDILNDYYDVALKQARLLDLQTYQDFTFHHINLLDHDALHTCIQGRDVTHILHLAAQAGVRYSLENPRAYIDSNVMGHLNILELARHNPSIEHVAYASSSSVYGDRGQDGEGDGEPFSETDRVRTPASLYAATKLGGEMLSESYWRLYGIHQTGLRFFTVYGPWGRPDMAYFIFVDKIFKNEPITLFAPDQMQRDFTYVSDIVSVLPTILISPPANGHAVYNLGNSKPNTLLQFVKIIEQACGRPAQKIIKEKQKGDVDMTFADVTAAERDFGFSPSITLDVGIPQFVAWYKSFYRV